MHKGVSNEHILVIKVLVFLIMGVNEDVKNLICENGPN